MESFLQSPEWQEIQEAMGRTTERVGPVLVIHHDLPFGFHYLYAPRPQNLTHDFFSEATRVAEKQSSLFLKVDPTEQNLESRISNLEIVSSASLQPSRTIFIETAASDDELLGAMHPKTRYNIRLAERHGVSVRAVSGDKARVAFDGLSSLFQETALRDGFHLHPPEHYRTLFSVESKTFKDELWIAEYRGIPLAAALVNWFRPGMIATYLHGASSHEYRNVMAPHLLHWQIIREARERGYASYDFGGIDEVLWPGVTRFKQGFGGRTHTFPPSRDYIFRSALYRMYRLQHRLRRITQP